MKLQFLISALFLMATARSQDSGIESFPLKLSNEMVSSSKDRSGAVHLSQKKARQESAKIKATNRKIAVKIQFRYFIIKAEGNTYGYSIYADGNLYIQQNTIPAVAGTRGFSDTVSAARTARLVIDKIKHGELPPAITIAELKKIGVH